MRTPFPKENRLIVVTGIRLDFYYHVEKQLVAARFAKLGLTAYGSTEASASYAFKKLFNTFVHVLRNKGRIEERLNRAGVEWYWAEDYPDNLPEYENTNHLRASSSSGLSAKWLPADRLGHQALAAAA